MSESRTTTPSLVKAWKLPFSGENGAIRKMKTRNLGLQHRGFTLLEIMTVVTLVGLLGAIAVPNYLIARDNARLNAIRRNLRTLDSAKEQWAADNNKPSGAAISDITVLQDYLRGGDIKPVVRETYEPNPVGTPPEAALPGDVKLAQYAPGSVIPAP
jgi:prepilin-type N-terminal cleavage/methylation domain-containing protein